jgi:membrane protease YdiL (CAAX protease family)
MNTEAINRAAKIIPVFITAICLTFSFSLATRLVPDTVPNTILARMFFWTPLMLVLHCLYRSLVLRKTLLPLYRIAVRTRAVSLILAGAAVLMALAILFPSPKHSISDMLYIIGIGVAGEEILFRGLLWDMADNYLVNHSSRFLHLSGTVWLTALAFGVMHFQYHNFRIDFASVFQVFYSVIIGLFLGVIRLRTESILWSMVVHASFFTFQFGPCIIAEGVSHVHVHVIGRYPGAPREYWGPRVDEWPEALRGAEIKIVQVAARLRRFLQENYENEVHESHSL